LSTSERAELLDYYIGKSGVANAAEFHRIFDLCAMQRLMQALGAYGFLGLVKERPHFLQHIAPALASLKQVVARIEGLEKLGETLAFLR
jgi:N-acetylmuramate 1-kinase